MAEAATTAVINKAVEIGADLIVKTSSRLYWLPEKIKRIETRMRHFQSCLKDAESKETRSHEYTNLINDIRDLAMDIEDTLDTYLPQTGSHKTEGKLGFIKHASCILCYGAKANSFALAIEELQRRTEELETRRNNCGVTPDANAGDADAETWDQRRKFLVSKESIIVGREKTLLKLEAKLRGKNWMCEIICVVGQAGVGKTTVCRKLFRQVQKEFARSALVYVSKDPKVRELLVEIANQVRLEKEKMNENFEDNLRLLLEENQCLIFLDDIWDTKTWDALKGIMPIDSKHGSRIIITSRYIDVGRYIGNESSLTELELLSEDKSWELFSRLIAPSMNTVTKQLEEIGRNIVKRCGRLPLAIEVVVGMLRRRRRNEATWNQVLLSMSAGTESDWLNVLSLSYKDLPMDLRPLFLYFGLFPEDHEIFVDDLVHSWVAEKLIQVDGAQNLKDVGTAKLELLCDRNLIVVSSTGLDGSIKSCRIHDLLHSLCIHIAKRNNFFHTTIGDLEPRMRRFTVNGDDLTQYFSSNPNTPKLRTLFYFSEAHLKSEKLCSIPKAIENLSSLTSLKLSGHFEKMSSSISNLKNLVTFDSKRAYFKCSLPRSVLRMKSLKYLLLGYFSQKNVVRNDAHLPKIETLYGAQLKASSLKKLSNVRKLKLSQVEDEHVDEISGKTPISEKLQELRLEEITEVDRLNLSCYHHLVELHLSGRHGDEIMLGLDRFPQSLKRLSLEDFRITNDMVKTLKELPRLEILKLKHNNYNSNQLDFSGAGFPELQVLAIKQLNVPDLIIDQTGMPKLSKFLCYGLRKEPDLNVLPQRLHNIMVSALFLFVIYGLFFFLRVKPKHSFLFVDCAHVHNVLEVHLHERI